MTYDQPRDMVMAWVFAPGLWFLWELLVWAIVWAILAVFALGILRAIYLIPRYIRERPLRKAKADEERRANAVGLINYLNALAMVRDGVEGVDYRILGWHLIPLHDRPLPEKPMSRDLLEWMSPSDYRLLDRRKELIAAAAMDIADQAPKRRSP